MAKVRAYVYVIHEGASTLLRPGDEVPSGVTVTNPDVLEPVAETAPAPEPEKAPTPTPEPAKKAPAKKAHATS